MHVILDSIPGEGGAVAPPRSPLVPPLAVTCIGKTIKLDLATSEGARARYARVCVEVDISKPLLGKYMIENRTFLVEYESLGNICVTCGFYGHKTEACTPSEHAKPSQGAEMSSDSSPTDQEGDAGEWMVVQRRNRGKWQKEKQEPPKKPPSGSRFVALGDSVDTRPKVAPHPKESDVNTAKLAASLAAVLSKAPQPHSEAGSSAGNGSGHPTSRVPLGDRTNEVNGTKPSDKATLIQNIDSSKSTKLGQHP
ncbi:hypothetical protein LINPERHAP2_LOCUS20922 [Linum perenne]